MRPIHYLGVFIPVAIALELAHAGPVLIFSAAALGVIPCAARDGRGHRGDRRSDRPGHRRPPERDVRQRAGADHRLLRAGRGAAGGREGVARRARSSATACSCWARRCSWAGWRREKQDVQPHRGERPGRRCSCWRSPRWCSRRSSSSSTAAACPPSAPTQVDFGSDLEHLSLGVALVLLVSYAAGPVLLAEDAPRRVQPVRRRARRRSTHVAGQARPPSTLALAAVAVGVMSEILVGSITRRLGRRSGCRSSSSACSWWRSWATPPSTGSPSWWPPRTRWTWR